ncbi:hypothetical protein [Sorangium sp. So ce117]|uniref:hypothetical protein n=1 Tax=Sorangium sp. So ce117 TaxID=3133277 RepID=UPI003F5DCF6C
MRNATLLVNLSYLVVTAGMLLRRLRGWPGLAGAPAGVFAATQRPAGERVAIGQPGERSASLTS